jgi:polyhydroxyalkanoate synthesis regulator phasin
MTERRTEFEGLIRVARITRIDADVLVEWVRREIVVPSPDGWDEQAVEAAVRARRLADLGVNTEGIEVAVHMRQRMLELQAEIEALRRQMRDLQRQQDLALARLIGELARDIDWSE